MVAVKDIWTSSAQANQSEDPGPVLPAEQVKRREIQKGTTTHGQDEMKDQRRQRRKKQRLQT